MKRVFDIREYFELNSIKSTFIFLKPFILKRKKVYWVLFTLLVIDVSLTIGFASFYGKIADAAVHANFKEIISLIPIALSLVIINMIFNFLDIYFETIATNGVKRDIKNHLFSHILRLPVKFSSQLRTGELITLFTNDVHNLNGVIGYSLLNLIRLPVTFLVVFIYLLQINVTMTLISVLVTPLAVFAGVLSGLLLRRNSRLLNSLYERTNNRITETFQGLSVVRSFALEEQSYHTLSQENNDLYRIELANAKLRGYFSSGTSLLGSTIYYVCLIIGAYYVSTADMTVGSLLTFLNLVGLLIYPLTGLAGQWAGFQHSVTSVERLVKVLGVKPIQSKLPAPAQPLEVTSIAIEHVSFSYDDVKCVFSNLQLSIPVGKVVAFVGPSGAGKSTLFSLLQGFYQPQSGRILINGVSLEAMSVSQLRSSFASVPQETFLFAGTIRENLLIARPGVSEEEMIAAAKSAYIHEYICSLDEGYDTTVGERGIMLSGGQKQRIAIARAILKNAPILLLDEATSALDTESEFYVKEALGNLMRERTTLVIAHRLSTIEHADFIVVMDKGSIVQMGTHHELLSQPGMYQKLYNHDFKPRELSVV